MGGADVSVAAKVAAEVAVALRTKPTTSSSSCAASGTPLSSGTPTSAGPRRQPSADVLARVRSCAALADEGCVDAKELVGCGRRDDDDDDSAAARDLDGAGEEGV
jgi:hypothetical protein